MTPRRQQAPSVASPGQTCKILWALGLSALNPTALGPGSARTGRARDKPACELSPGQRWAASREGRAWPLVGKDPVLNTCKSHLRPFRHSSPAVWEHVREAGNAPAFCCFLSGRLELWVVVPSTDSWLLTGPRGP